MIDAYGLPLKDDGILEIAAKSGGRIITVEDNYTGGLDAEIADADRRQRRGRQAQGLFVHQIPKSGREPQEVLDYLGLGMKAILAAV